MEEKVIPYRDLPVLGKNIMEIARELAHEQQVIIYQDDSLRAYRIEFKDRTFCGNGAGI